MDTDDADDGACEQEEEEARQALAARWEEGKKARFLTAQGEKRWWRWRASRVGGGSSMVGRPNVHHSHSTTWATVIQGRLAFDAAILRRFQPLPYARLGTLVRALSSAP